MDIHKCNIEARFSSGKEILQTQTPTNGQNIDAEC